jgi:hypothetical protein
MAITGQCSICLLALQASTLTNTVAVGAIDNPGKWINVRLDWGCKALLPVALVSNMSDAIAKFNIQECTLRDEGNAF